MPLPTYPFRRERYWVALNDSYAYNANETGENRAFASRLHPLIAANVSTLEQQKFVREISARDFFIRDHRLQSGGGVFPGTAYLEMARAGLQIACEEKVPGLCDVVWETPLFVGERPARLELFIFAANESHSVEFELESETFGVHSHGRVLPGVSVSPANIDLAGLRANFSDAMTPAALYAMLERNGLLYGPTFQCVRGVQLRGDEALIDIEASQALRAAGELREDYVLNPALLDAAFHAAACLMPELERSTFVPAALNELRIFDAIPAECVAHIRRRSESNAHEAIFDIRLIAPRDGAVLVDVVGLQLRSIAPVLETIDDAASAIESNRALHFFRTQFVEVPLVGDRQKKSDPRADVIDNLLVYDPRGSEIPAVLRRASDEADVSSEIRLRAVDNIQSLTQLLGSGEFTRIFYYDTRPSEGAIALLEIFEFTQAILRSAKNANFAVVYGREDGGADAVHLNCAALEAAAVAGLLRAAGEENPNLRFRAVSGANIIEHVAEEFRDMSSRNSRTAQEVQYENGKRLERCTIDVEDSLNSAEPEPRMSFREGGVYLITGGAGALGRLFADYLAREFGARTILLGRRFPPASARDAVGEFIQCDVTDHASLETALREIKTKYGAIHGVLHAAGVLADDYLIHKTPESIRGVLAPKVAGAMNLDALLAGEDSLEQFILFSSVAGVAGNAGQADYGAANAFLNEFARERNRLRAAGQRAGRTIAIAWPLWAASANASDARGMSVSDELAAEIRESTGLRTLNATEGLRAFARIVDPTFADGADCVVVAPGDRAKITRFFGVDGGSGHSAAGVRANIRAQVGAAGNVGVVPGAKTPVSPHLRAAAESYFLNVFAKEVKLPVHRLGVTEPLQKYGIDSVMIVRLNRLLTREFGPIPKTLFFEYGNLKELTGYFLDHHADALAKLLGDDTIVSVAKTTLETSVPVAINRRSRQRSSSARFAGPARFAATKAVGPADIAIIGVSGRYPGAEDLDAYWKNLREGRDCIVEIPEDRWGEGFFDADKDRPARSYGRWGGFIDGADCFDPLFFNISPREAEQMDPQERLFLQTVWNTIEDAGYTARGLSARSSENNSGDDRANAAVFVGVMWGEYQLFGAREALAGGGATARSNYWSIANRVSYVMDFHGPSMAIDTACSSSLTAVHLACESLLRGEARFAIAGGVNLSLHPYKYIQLSRGRFLASDGRCRSFGEGGDGYVPGEGVGAVLLRPLAEAEAAGDRILAVIKGSAINHGGTTNGFTVPSPNAQGELIFKTLRRAGVDPTTLGYIEAHGTGTSLGDPIEIAGLTRAFREYREKIATNGGHASGHTNGDAQAKVVPIGSVKSNIGHLESAAGIAGLTKVLLQLREGELAPSLMHSERLNPNIEFQDTPFRVIREPGSWDRPGDGTAPRRAAISSFGAGGSNAHVILEEYIDQNPTRGESSTSVAPAVPQIVPLSARTPDRLMELAARLLKFIEKDTPSRANAGSGPANDIANIAYTLREGRVALDERLAFVVADLNELREALASFVRGETHPSMLQGAVAPETKGTPGLRLVDSQADRDFLKHLHAQGQDLRIAELWVAGAAIDWRLLYEPARRVALPTYPFARERYWIQSEFDFNSEDVVAPEIISEKTCLIREWREAPLVGVSDRAARVRILFLIPDRHVSPFRKYLSRNKIEDHIVLSDKRGGRPVTSAKTSFEFDVDFSDPTLVARALEVLRESANGRKPDAIVDLLDYFDRSTDEGAAEQVEPAPGRVALYQSMLEQQVPTFLHVTRGVQSFQNEAPHLCGAVWNGFVRVFGAEYARVNARTIDVCGDEFRSVEDLFAMVEREARHRGDEREGEVCYRNGRRFGPYYREQPLLDPVTIEADGVYVISGGTRGLGAAFARRLVALGARKLVLMGREALPERGDWARVVAAASSDETVSRGQIDKLRTLLELEAAGARVELYSGSLNDGAALGAFFKRIRKQWGAIRGVLHCAGIVSDENPAFIHKNQAEISAVLDPKIRGTRTLAKVFAADRPDWFVLFSSVSGTLPALGIGLSDYAAANSYLDFFAAAEHAKGRRWFKSVNWPSWTDTGFGEVASDRYRATGLLGLSTEAGLDLFERTVGLSAPVVLPAVVNRSIFRVEEIAAPVARTAASTNGARKNRSGFEHTRRPLVSPAPQLPPEPTAQAVVANVNSVAVSAVDAVKIALKELFAKELKLPLERFEDERNFSEYGVDSVLLAAVVRKIERWLGHPFDPSSMLEYPTLGRLSDFITRQYGDKSPPGVGVSVAVASSNGTKVSESASPLTQPVAPPPAPGVAPVRFVSRTPGEVRDDRVAIIGMACRMPGANDLAAYWDNLANGRASITEVPKERWDVNRFYSPEPAPGKSISKWGGFIAGADLFDAQYFRIDESLALQMDPLQRLCLEHGLLAMLDAGYEPGELAGRRVGVYVGSRSSMYANRIIQPDRNTVIGVGQNFIAARLSDYFNFTGTNLVVDTACSSSLVSLHLACRALTSGQEELALVGGVDLLLDEMSYLSLSAAQALSPDGKCHTFDLSANGFVPGEGCGMVMLKPLANALRDGDQVYAVIRGSAVNNDGRTMGITTPNVDAQVAVIQEALERTGIDPRGISCMETHGTGTMIGDPIELKALTRVFRQHTDAREFCAVGSVKTNIGHLLSAAGIASAIKIALALHHRELPPTLNCETPNPRFAFSESPFFPNTSRRAWDAEVRRAGISSFGFGGTNCHLLMEQAPRENYTPRRGPLPVPAFQKKSFWLPKRSPGEAETNGHHASTTIRPLMFLERVQ